MTSYDHFLKDRPRHWRDMEAVASDALERGDLIFTSLDDLHAESESEIRILVARPETGRILLVSSSRKPDEDSEAKASVIDITSGDDDSFVELGKRWDFIRARAAVKAANQAVGGTIIHTWCRIWSTGHLHILARVARNGMHDSLRTITVAKPGGVFKPQVLASVGFMRPLPKLFKASGTIRVHGEIGSKGTDQIGIV
ncbi:hypothetical protein G6L37_05035 [Agrobacterium rubi]|nr:hypothetical protein [Agrobacterium rubi]NTF24720.1 hypothetical protein [Agrobacterium rubi]